MTFTCRPLFAEAAEGVVRTRFEWGRIQENSDWIVPIGVCLAIMLFVRAMYRRDAVELPPVLGWLLTALRTATFLGLLILYLQPQWRSQHEVARNSRVMLLVDTSLSMGLTDEASPLPASGARGEGSKSRIQRVAAALDDTDFLKRLRKTHDVAVWRFNENLDRARVALDKLVTPSPSHPLTPTSPHEPTDWSQFLTLGGSETRLGTALRQLINDENGSPLSGVVLLSDGGQNAGIGPEPAIELAQKTKLPVFTVGIGSGRSPVNVDVSDLTAPARAYPGDGYVVTGFVRAQGLGGEVVEVELLSRESADGTDQKGTGEVEDRQQVTLGGDGEVIPVPFELTCEQTGRRTLVFRVRTPEGDSNADDDFLEADVEIVDHKNRVLMFAGGPMREYRFLRTQLYRDRSTTLDVLLQTARPGMSQEADKVLDAFPSTREEMFQYDCLVAFDPDWQALSTAQVDLVEQWVAERGGGLIVVAGAVHTGAIVGGWVEAPAMAKIRALYPVEFHRRFSVLEESVYLSEEPRSLDFTREGLEAQFLWLDDTASGGRRAWSSFEGVYSCCPVRGPKPGATVLARFSDPKIGFAGRQPVFFASQFYGSGRVFYLGSGEMWRLRKVDEGYFEQFYTKLIRHVSQGRLLRQSSRGVLLTGQERYLLGNTVEIRAQLSNARFEPLETPAVDLQAVRPDGNLQNVTLRPDAGRIGTYAGRFPVLQEGAYRLELAIPESDELLSRRIQVKVPELEREHPQRNDPLLKRIAEGTGGAYYVGLDALSQTGSECLAERLKDRTRIEILPDAPNSDWQQKWLRWMMYTLCGLLCLEWLIRRLAKLA